MVSDVPIVFIVAQHWRGVKVDFVDVWRRILQKIISILGTYVLLVALVLVPGSVVIFLYTQFFIQDASVGFPSIFLLLLIVKTAVVYFLVKWSLYNQCIILENLSTIAAFRRSGELVRGAWGRFFGIYLLLALVTMVFTTAVFGLTLLLLSVAAPEFAPLREVLLSGRFFGIFFGSYVKITLQSAPVWAIGVMVVVNTLINAVFAPIWAILTTHLYMEQAGVSEQPVSG